MANSKIPFITDQDFPGLFGAGALPVLVAFYADWCGPCRALGPVLEDIAEEYKGRLLVVKVDVDTSVELTSQFGITSIPTLILFNAEGLMVERRVGAQPARFIRRMVEEALQMPPAPHIKSGIRKDRGQNGPAA